MSNFNYFDNFAPKLGDYYNYVSQRHINASSPKIKLYLLDRHNGPSNKIYGEDPNRIYLPYFSIRGMYLTQQWTQGLMSQGIEEQDVNTTDVVLNFDNMTSTMRNLKNLHKYDIFIKYTGANRVYFSKSRGVLYIKENCVITHQIDTTQYSIKELSDYINTLTNYISRCDSGAEGAQTLADFPETQVDSYEELNIYSFELIYQGIQEMIKPGDIFITHHNVMYEIMDAFPMNLKFYTWPSYMLKGEKRRLSDNTKLPNSGLDIIYDNGLLLGNNRNSNSYSQ